MKQVRSASSDWPRWYSLWHGDPGAALVAADCLEGRAAFPLLDGW